MNYFWIDTAQNITKTYDDLIEAINQKTKYKKYIYTGDTFELWVDIFADSFHNFQIHLLDSDFTNQEIKNLGIHDTDLKESYRVDFCKFTSFSDLLKKIQVFSEKSNIVIYTSGTTGKPKKVALNLNVLARNVKRGDDYRNHIWAFAYNPTHFAGLQVFFQAVLNQNTMVNIFDVDNTQMPYLFTKYKISHISATPTFYRKLLLSIENEYPHVLRITLGGERFDTSLETELRSRFPNARIKNIYASTEAGTLFSSDSECFTIPAKTMSAIKISEDGELLIHKRYLGEFDSSDYAGDWYHSGDLVEFISENTFKFI